MHNTVQNLINIENKIKANLNDTAISDKINIIAVSKTFKMDKILPLVQHGHIDYGENKVQEAIDKWTDIKKNNSKIKLHMIGRLQTNKVKNAVRLFDYIHSVDSLKLAKKISEEELKTNKKIKIFVQVNIGQEKQKSGAIKNEVNDLVEYCLELNLNLIGLMCIPPLDEDVTSFFKEMKKLNGSFGFSELSMGMSSDYLKAVENSATYLRIGSNIFGSRS